MIRFLLHFLLVLCLFGLCMPGMLYAQTDAKSKSRLYIQRSLQKPTLPILLSKRSFQVNPYLQTNLDLKQNTFVSQYLKATYAKSSSTNTVNGIAERRLVEENMNNDKYLFYNDRIQVSHVYPNPASDFVDVDYQLTSNQDFRLSFYNVIGEQVKEFSLDRDQRTMRISLRDFSSGMYLYQLSIDGRSVATKKLIVRKGM
ncbi:T9SS type A sorting domain-containing protein [Aquirufa sp.]|jgi:hypothetical protein|uniref:T9SS type A sorting domain-containing protein n=1 Tax=Aquirufa sp. TaxID=2676249 RepID=UPI0037C15915